MRAAKSGSLVIFAGAGISTESSTVFPTSLYDNFKSDADLVGEATFPKVMSAFEDKFGRRELVARIAERLDYVESFPSIRTLATRFHTELSTIGSLSTIITTNWDTAFERYCSARPLVVDDDYAYYDLPGRKVFKIHGSMSNISTLVATENDYAEREASFATSAMGSSLKHILATQTVVFIGFSLSDPDFQSVYRALLTGLGKSRPVAYIVTPFESPAAGEFQLRPLTTDGTYFIRKLKERLVDDDVQLPDEVIDRAGDIEYAARATQQKVADLDWQDSPPLLFTLSYLDGISDCTSRARLLARSGEYTNAHHLTHLAHSYNKLWQTAIERERWWDAAYIRGYLDAIVSFFAEDEETADLELMEPFDMDGYPGIPSLEPQPGQEKAREATPERDTRDLETTLLDSFDEATLRARFEESPFTGKESVRREHHKIVNSLPPGMIPNHTPFLDGVLERTGPLPAL